MVASPASASIGIEPCNQTSPDRLRAEELIASINQNVGKLTPGDDYRGIIEQLKQLGALSCFQIGGKVFPDAAGAQGLPDSVASLKDYWENGGRHSVEAYLTLASTSFLYTAPEFRKTWSRESSPKDPLASLLCPEKDEACQRATSGYRLRAVRRFAVEQERERLELEAADRAESSSVVTQHTDCDQLIAAMPERLKFTYWLQCIQWQKSETPDFHLVGLARPTDGWLLLATYSGICTELGAYHLGTGAAFSIESCGDSARPRDEETRSRKLSPASNLTYKRGTIPAELLREAAWFLMSAAHMAATARSEGYAVPDGIPRVYYPDEHSGRFGGSYRGCGSSHGRTARWRYLVKGQSVTSGTLSAEACGWDKDGDDYAFELLEIAQGGFEEGCPQVIPPQLPLTSHASRGRETNGEVKDLAVAGSELARGWHALRSKRCGEH